MSIISKNKKKKQSILRISIQKNKTRSMLDHMCDESDDRKHFHTACGDRLCGFVNEMQAQMLFTTLWGPPPDPTPPPVPPVIDYDLCWKCKPHFNTSYCLYLPPWECTHNHIESVEEPSNRQFCVDSRVMLDGHTVKLPHSALTSHNVSLDSLFYLPGAHYVTVQHDSVRIFIFFICFLFVSVCFISLFYDF